MLGIISEHFKVNSDLLNSCCRHKQHTTAPHYNQRYQQTSIVDVRVLPETKTNTAIQTPTCA